MDPIQNIPSIAIIGMSCRFPKAKTPEDFWKNLRDGVEAVTEFSKDDLVAAGVDPAFLNHPAYVPNGIVLEDVEMFDASFFDLSDTEAELMDPQHRIFFESAWEALERAGYDSTVYKGQIGLFAGVDLSTYQYMNVYAGVEALATFSKSEVDRYNEKDFFTARVASKLNLKGPAVTVQTTCSTSLVAIIHACQSLLNYQCDMALAGGSAITLPQKTGYFYQEGGISSPDGHCCAFDARARGTTGGSGAGVIVLKRLEDALDDGDHIEAVIRGFGINNDGSDKVGFTAPSLEGQAAAIAMAQAMAGVSADDITYVEAHGTGTVMGDPIEVGALTQVFRNSTNRKGYCGLGSVKTNMGHCNSAAGVAGLIKTVLALKNKMLPPSLHYVSPNPHIDFANSPFYVVNSLRSWDVDQNRSRLAGVSSFGIGGTNAHVVLEEAPIPVTSSASRNSQLLVLSARSATALDVMCDQLQEHLTTHPDIPIADVAFTLQTGRKRFAHRRIYVLSEQSRSLQEGLRADEVVTVANTEVTNVYIDAQSIEKIPGNEIEDILYKLGKHWLSGLDINWEDFYKSERRQKVILPTYPFERKRYWMDANWKLTRKETQSNAFRRHFYTDNWQKSTHPSESYYDNISNSASSFLIFSNPSEFGNALYKKLKASGKKIIQVLRSEKFIQIDESVFGMDITNPVDYNRLFEHLQSSSLTFDTIIHLYNFKERSFSWDNNTNELDGDDKLLYPFLTLLHLGKALAAFNFQNKMRLEVVANRLHRFHQLELSDPILSLLSVACRLIGESIPNLEWQTVDIDYHLFNQKGVHTACDQLLDELNYEMTDAELILRNNDRLSYALQKISFPLTNNSSLFKPGNKYLFTGAVNDMIWKFAEYLMETEHSTVIFAGDQYSSDTKNRDKWLQKGYDFVMLRVEITNYEEVKEMESTIFARYGKLDGIFNFDDPQITSISDPGIESKFVNTVECVYNLQAVFRDYALAFFVLGTFNPGYRYFQDAFARQHYNRFGVRYFSVCFGNVATGNNADSGKDLFSLIDHIISSHHPQVLISGRNPENEIQKSYNKEQKIAQA